MSESFRLSKLINGITHYAEVAVKVEAITGPSDEVVVSLDSVSNGQDEGIFPFYIFSAQAGCLEATFFLRIKLGNSTRYRVTLYGIKTAPADTNSNDIRVAAIAATYQQVFPNLDGLELEPGYEIVARLR